MDLVGCELKKLRADADLVLYRAHPANSGPPLLVLSPVSAHPDAATLVRLEHEHGLASELDPAWAAKPLALEHYRGRTVLVLTDPGGQPLSGILTGPLGLKPFLPLAISIVAALNKVHALGLIHKDIKPANLLVDAAGHVWLTGFGLATRLPRQRQEPSPPEVIAGTLAYMAPEQTGRMNRSVDTRSDLYALGVTFFEMLTGTLPFAASDALEWIYCHIARPPPLLSQRVEGVPEPVEAILLKLLSKTGEDRYQTAVGLEHDLRHCLAQWQANDRVDPFTLGTHDPSDRLTFPDKLYGREAEVKALLAAYERAVETGTTELVLVSGYSGAGKSSLVNELRKVLAPSGGLFASGKFDQYKRDIPYATLAEAFRDIIRQLLSTPDLELERWRAALQGALGVNAQLVVSLIPELALIIGEPPVAPEVPPPDRQNRFNRLFRRFIGVFARPEHPLVLFLDDMQWLDRASLELLERLATEPDLGSLLLIGAYRENEVGTDHPLLAMLSRLQSTARLSEIVLSALTPENVERILADALRMSEERVRALSELVCAKTVGNPFFAIQFILTLADENLLVFDATARIWQWDVEGIKAKGIADNVVDLMAGRLTRFSPSSPEVLGLMACVGSSSHSKLLSLLVGLPDEDVHQALSMLVSTGLVLRRGDVYAFAHDRVHEAAYALVPEAERAKSHLAIGRILAAEATPDQVDTNIFEITSHFNRGSVLVDTIEERDHIASLNLIAGKKAKASTAYGTALRYFAAGRVLLGPNSWERQRQLAFELELHEAECEFLTGDLAPAEDRLIRLSRRASNPVELAGIAQIVIPLLTSVGRADRAIEVGLGFLQHIGISWSSRPTDEEIAQEYEAVYRQLGLQPVETLIDLPAMVDLEHTAIMQVLVEIQQPAYFIDQKLFTLVIGRMTNLSLAHGNCDASAVAYCLLVMILGPRFGDHQTGLQFGRLALDLVESHGYTRFAARVFTVSATYVMPWTNSLSNAIPLVQSAFDAAVDAGDLAYAAWARSLRVDLLVACGTPLPDVQVEAQNSLLVAVKASHSILITISKIQIALVLSLRGLMPHFGSLTHSTFNEEDFERDSADGPENPYLLGQYYTCKTQARFFAGDYESALDAATKAQEHLSAIPVFFETAECLFYAALTRAAWCTSMPHSGRSEQLEALAANHQQLERWAHENPENFYDRATLVAAEIARLQGRESDAERLYKEAVQAAQQQAFTQNEAIGHELAARFHYARGDRLAGDSCLRNARSCYSRWGADGKVRQLDKNYANLLEELVMPAADGTIRLPVEHLDLATIVKVSQAISGEIDLKRLIHTLMRIVLEHSGGDRALLILPHGNSLFLEAEATTVRDTIEIKLRRTPVTVADLPGSVMRYVLRTRNKVLLDNVDEQNPYSGDTYLVGGSCRSLVCLPLIKQSALAGVLYLESASSSRVFTPARTEVLMLIASQAAISLENARLYADLQRTKANLDEAQRLTHTGSFTFDTTTQSLFWSDEIYRIYQRDPEKGITLEDVVPQVLPEDRHLLEAFIGGIPHDGEPHSFEHRILVPDGSIKTLRIIAHSEHDESGNVTLVGTAIDVTERKRMDAGLQSSLQEKDALLKEVHHRVKNNLQLISSMLNLQASRSKEPAEAERFAESRNRVRSMALVHENLYRTGDFANVSMVSHINALCKQLARAYRMSDQSIDVVADVDSIELDLDRAVSVGLIINELVSNALKHAFPDGRSGLVQVSLKRSNGARCILAVRDTGTGLPHGFDVGRAETLGLQLVQDLTQQLRGTMTIIEGAGAAFIVVFDASVQERPESFATDDSRLQIHW